MYRERFWNLVDKCENNFWKLYYYLWKVRNPKENTILEKNLELKDLYKGETCFILGNGPSLKQENRLKELENYKVFTVNQFFRSELFEVVKPNYHIIIDPLFFKLNPNVASEKDTLFRIKEIAKRKDVTMILSLDFLDYICKYIGNKNKHFYVKSRYKLTDGYNNYIDMCSFLPTAYNVVQIAIYCAMFMGFSKIVLLGCDMTGIMDNYVRYSKKGKVEKFTHVYEYTREEKMRMEDVHRKHSNEFMLYGFYNMFRDFRMIDMYCKANDIHLLNATNETALDMIKHVRLEDILDEDKDGKKHN